MSLRLEDASFQEDAHGNPYLQIMVNAHPARITLYDQKFLHRDIVFLGSEWADRVEEIELPADRKRGWKPITLRGFVQDKRLAQMIRKLRAEEYVWVTPVGPVEIPREED